MEPRKPFTVVELEEAKAKLFSSDHMELARKQRELVFDAIAEMRKELNRTLEQIVHFYAEPKVTAPFTEEKLKAAGIEVYSGVALNSDLTYKVLQFGKQIGPDVTIKWPGIKS